MSVASSSCTESEGAAVFSVVAVFFPPSLCPRHRSVQQALPGACHGCSWGAAPALSPGTRWIPQLRCLHKPRISPHLEQFLFIWCRTWQPLPSFLLELVSFLLNMEWGWAGGKIKAFLFAWQVRVKLFYFKQNHSVFAFVSLNKKSMFPCIYSSLIAPVLVCTTVPGEISWRAFSRAPPSSSGSLHTIRTTHMLLFTSLPAPPHAVGWECSVQWAFILDLVRKHT